MKLIPTSTQPVTITLYQGIPFDNNYNETALMFSNFSYKNREGSSQHAVGHNKEDFINMKINNVYVYPRTSKSGTYNFAFGNGLVTSVVVELTENEINSNYMKVTSGSDNYYYFITGITQKNEVTYQLNLELDVFMTFGGEFLTNIANKPVMVERKHCRRLFSGDVLPYTRFNKILYNQESIFKGIKPNIVSEVEQLTFKGYEFNSEDLGINEEYNDIISNLKWCYAILTAPAGNQAYFENGVGYPYRVYVFPMEKMVIKLGNVERVIDPDDEITRLMGDPNVLKIIISPFPPFNVENSGVLNLCMSRRSDNTLVLQAEFFTRSVDSNQVYSNYFYSGKSNKGSRFFFYSNNESAYVQNGLRLLVGVGGKYAYQEKSGYFEYTSPNSISINDDKDVNEFKLQIAPFRELKMSSHYGIELYVPTELLFLRTRLQPINNMIEPYTIASSNPEVNSYCNYVDMKNNDLSAKRCVSSSVSYSLPTSVDAMQVFNLTARNQYETSISNATRSNGFKAIASIGNYLINQENRAMSNAITGLGSFYVNEKNNIEMYNAKMTDLENTPDKYSFGGSSFPYDYAISVSNEDNTNKLLPYLITYTCDETRYKMASEYLYKYGYDFNKECYFSTQITLQTDNVFERRLFNYVKIREDITSKIVGSNLPLIVAQKINEVLNAGICFWTFFSMNLGLSSVASDVIDKYFQKTTYCNAELNGGNLN